ncbi:MAG: hypothetical protein ISR95_07710 [Candidatus Marinimicrobia bacterium]|nr:hypothetical protein [Candidatus Neomarinimicrobiota bacterium]
MKEQCRFTNPFNGRRQETNIDWCKKYGILAGTGVLTGNIRLERDWQSKQKYLKYSSTILNISKYQYRASEKC